MVLKHRWVWISIHASRGGSDGDFILLRVLRVISIHASRGGSDRQIVAELYVTSQFQSTLPAGEATAAETVQRQIETNFNPRFPRGKRPPYEQVLARYQKISIHASRGGSDSTVKLSPDDRTKQHGFREPGFSGFLSAVSMLFFFWALGVRAYRIMMSLGSYPFFVPI